jgi:hypothetical protein
MNEPAKKINWEHIKFRVKEALFTLPHFFKNPVRGMRELPDWDWPEILILQGAFAAICSVISNLIQRDILGLITGFVIAPVMYLMMVAILTGLFYYAFKFAFQRELPFRGIYIHVLFASIPMALVSTVAYILPPLMLAGAIASTLLLYVGFLSNYQLSQKPLRNFLGGLLVVYALYWMIEMLSGSSKHKSMRLRATPESLDILERELKSN